MEETFLSFLRDNFILEGISRGMSANVIQGIMKGTELGMNRQALLSRIRELANVPAKASVLRYVPNNATISQQSYTEGGSYMTKNYLYHVRFDVSGNSPGGKSTLYQIVSSNTPMTPGEVKSTALARLPFENPKYDFEVVGQAIEIAYKNPDLP